MFRIFNMLLQNLTNMGSSFSGASFDEKSVNLEFTDSDGVKYSCWICKKEEKKDA